MPAQWKGQSMDVNDPKWFRSMGEEKLWTENEIFFRRFGAKTPAEIEEKKKQWHEAGEQIIKGLFDGCTDKEDEREEKDMEKNKVNELKAIEIDGEIIVYRPEDKENAVCSFKRIGVDKYLMTANHYTPIEITGKKITLTEKQKELIKAKSEEKKEATDVLEAMPSDMVVVNKMTGDKAILLSLTGTDNQNHFIAVDKNGELLIGDIGRIKVILTDEQKALLK